MDGSGFDRSAGEGSRGSSDRSGSREGDAASDASHDPDASTHGPTDPDINDLLAKLDALSERHRRRGPRTREGAPDHLARRAHARQRRVHHPYHEVHLPRHGRVVRRGGPLFAPLLVEGGVFEIAGWLAGTSVAGVPVFLLAHVAFVLVMTAGLLYAADFRQIEIRHPILGVIPRRYAGVLLVSLFTSAFMLLLWGRLHEGDPTGPERGARVLVVWAVAAFGAGLGDILPGESQGARTSARSTSTSTTDRELWRPPATTARTDDSSPSGTVPLSTPFFFAAATVPVYMSALRDALRDLPDAVFADLLESDEGYVLVVDLPGATAETTEVLAEDGRIVIEGRREGGPRRVPLRARGPTVFLDAELPLPSDADGSGADAEMDRGVLEMTIPKADRWRLPYDPGRRGRRRRSRRLRGGYAGQSPCLLAVFVVVRRFSPLIVAYWRDRKRYFLFGGGREVDAETQRERAAILLDILLTLGPRSFIKLGQILSTRPDILPPAYIDVFGGSKTTYRRLRGRSRRSSSKMSSDRSTRRSTTSTGSR